MDLTTLWSCLIGLAFILYIVLDGFGLGVGILFSTARDEEERDRLMKSIAPVWDANQTWLVLGAGATFVAFPVAYGILFSALYIPLLTFVFGLIFRGVAFEFRANAPNKKPWNLAFFLGSLVAVVAQGLTLGGIVSGVKVVESRFAGGSFDWLNPFSVAVGIALVIGYILLASTYLIIKTTGVTQERAYSRARGSAIIVLAFMILITFWTPIHYPRVLKFWFSFPRIYFIWSFPLVGLIAFYILLKSLKGRREILPFLCTVVFFLTGYFGLIASLYPYAVPPSVTFREAAAQLETLRLTFWGATITLPLVLAYTAYTYAVFRGKVDQAEYHY
jgi:cytochrome d ubiquinol oxidase subunit II